MNYSRLCFVLLTFAINWEVAYCFVTICFKKLKTLNWNKSKRRRLRHKLCSTSPPQTDMKLNFFFPNPGPSLRLCMMQGSNPSICRFPDRRHVPSELSTNTWHQTIVCGLGPRGTRCNLCSPAHSFVDSGHFYSSGRGVAVVKWLRSWPLDCEVRVQTPARQKFENENFCFRRTPAAHRRLQVKDLPKVPIRGG